MQKRHPLRMSFFWVTSGARTHDTRNHNPMLCQLSYSHRVCFRLKAGAKVLLFFDMTKYFAKKMSRILLLLIFFRFFSDYFVGLFLDYAYFILGCCPCFF